MRVHDGIDNTSAVIGTYCGQQRNLVLYSSESNLFIHFFTLQRTANTQNRGFKGIFEFSESFVKLDFIREFVEFQQGLFSNWLPVRFKCFSRRKRWRSHSRLRMRSENFIEERVNGLCLFAKLPISLRTESSLQVRLANDADAFMKIYSIWLFFSSDISYMECKMHRILNEWS